MQGFTVCDVYYIECIEYKRVTRVELGLL